MDIFLTFESPTFVFYPPAPKGSNNGEPGGIVVGRFEYRSERVKNPRSKTDNNTAPNRI